MVPTWNFAVFRSASFGGVLFTLVDDPGLRMGRFLEDKNSRFSSPRVAPPFLTSLLSGFIISLLPDLTQFGMAFH